MLCKAHIFCKAARLRGGFTGLFLHQQHLPPEATPTKPSGLLVGKSTAEGARISAPPSPQLLLLQGIITSNHPRLGRVVGDDSAPPCMILKERGVTHWTNGLFLRAPWELHRFPCSQVLQQGPCCFFGRLLRTVTDQGFDASSRGSCSSSPQILPRQISVSGWGWSVVNNSSTASSGVRSAVESTSTWVPGLRVATRSFTILTSETVTPPTIKMIRRG